MSSENQTPGTAAPQASSSESVPIEEHPPLNLKRIHSHVRDLIAMGVIVPNSGDCAPKDEQDDGNCCSGVLEDGSAAGDDPLRPFGGGQATVDGFAGL